MNRTNELFDAFLYTCSERNARALVRHVERNPHIRELFTFDHESMLRNAELILQHAAQQHGLN